MGRRRPTRRQRPVLTLGGLVAGVAMLALGAVVAVAWVQHGTIARLQNNVRVLQHQVDVLIVENGDLSAENDELGQQLKDSLRDSQATQARAETAQRALHQAQVQAQADANAPPPLTVREVHSPADFPIERAMAQSGDTVAGFAAREGTTEAVVRALNPWLNGAESLKAWQTLWVPKKHP